MKEKISPIIIAVIALVLVAIGIFIYSLINSNGSENQIVDNSSQQELVKPILNLSLNTEEENQEKVNIIAKASMEDGSGIEKIILPDGTVTFGAETTYTVTENGDYEFKVVSETGIETINYITISNIKEISAFNPYIPLGFTHVEGTEVETGFVIEDEYGNQYVWVPVENGQLTRETILDSNYEESDVSAGALVNSVAQNYGFYIGKYEASRYELNGEFVAATMAAQNPWTNITYQDAVGYANTVSEKFGYEDVKSAMLNSYVWDTVLKWFDKSVQNYSTNTNYGNYSGSIYPTGGTETDIIYNICDIAGNVREWTTEIFKSVANSSGNNVTSRVIRGGSANLSRTPKSHTGYAEDTYEAYWGFRIILYK